MAIVLNAITEAVLKGGRKEFHTTTIANMLNCELANYCYIYSHNWNQNHLLCQTVAIKNKHFRAI